MEQRIRCCLDCGTDISVRHWRSKRCSACQFERERTAMNTKPPTTYARRCEGCGSSYKAQRQQRYCSQRCGGRYSIGESARRAAGVKGVGAPTERMCIVCDGSFTAWKVDTCSRACSRWARLHPGRKRVRECGRCRGPIKRPNINAAYCSYTCAAVAGQARREGRIAAVPRAFCLACGGPIVGRTARAIYCTRACEAIKTQERRAAKISGAVVERIYPIDIYERDEWCCHLCGENIDSTLTGRDPLRVSLDHVIPVAAPGFPGHVWENVAAAHLRCNIVKGDALSDHDRALYAILRTQRAEILR